MGSDGDNETRLEILKELKNGEITCWYELEIRSAILGFEMDSKFVCEIIELSMYSTIYNMIYSTMTESDAMDRYFEDSTLISKMLKYEDSAVFLSHNVIPITERSCMVLMLKELDIRNPRYLLKYFLNIENIVGNDYTYMLFLDVIERTKKRAEKCKVFEKYVERLENSFNSSMTLRMFSN